MMVMPVVAEEKPQKIEPIYEKLMPGEVLIISKEGNCVTYAVNEGGKVVLRKACLSEED
jgi:hypothetical protein